MPVEMIVPAEPSDHHQEAILAPLLAYNESQIGRPFHAPVAILLKEDAASDVVGGLWGKVYYDWLFVELLFVPEHLRGTRLGSQMIAKAEDIARKKNCVGVWLDTFSFQAPEFYRKLGYEVFGSLDNYPVGKPASSFKSGLPIPYRLFQQDFYDLSRVSVVPFLRMVMTMGLVRMPGTEVDRT